MKFEVENLNICVQILELGFGNQKVGWVGAKAVLKIAHSNKKLGTSESKPTLGVLCFMNQSV